MNNQNALMDLSSIEPRLRRLYGSRADEALQEIAAAVKRVDLKGVEGSEDRWNQQDVVLITYGDQVQSAELNPLQTLRKFLSEQGLSQTINTVHFLPCFPYTSDDGFSVVDYRRIDPELGDWSDVHDVGKDFKLMLDFVVNHVSQESEWFQRYLRGDSPFDQYFIEADPDEDLSAVTRPRSLPLLSDFETSRGKRWLWTTFSRDQLDLNYAEPALLAEVIEILLEYIAHGATIIRLDAIAYLWKQIGTSCIHLPQTHEVVKLLREVLVDIAPHVLLLTETNVPHDENVSYFGDGDEAHMVYQFSLPPLLLDAFLNDDAAPLKRWLEQLPSAPEGCTYFNFTASHDGIGVRPLEGQVSDERLASLVEKTRARGGLVGTRRLADGSDKPYELNVSYVDALMPENGDESLHAARFLASQAVMSSLQGVPAIYFHSLVGSRNDLAGAESSGIPRRINRRKFMLEDLSRQIHSQSISKTIFDGLQRLLRVRIRQPAFHPDADQQYIESGSPVVLCFQRSDRNSDQAILVAVNFGSVEESISVPPRFADSHDLLGSEPFENTQDQGPRIHLKPAQVVWLNART